MLNIFTTNLSVVNIRFLTAAEGKAETGFDSLVYLGDACSRTVWPRDRVLFLG